MKISNPKYLLVLITSVFTIYIGKGQNTHPILTGADQTELYIPYLKGKSVAVVANQTSVIGTTHLVDSLLSRGINIKKVFAPEHGFRGSADAGAHVKNAKDTKTGLPIISLYGGNKKPKAHQLHDVDIVLFDIQDVGARFYTYISTMHYVMEACAENVKEFWILDRPNPNGFYVDGPILQKKKKSFIGMHPIPIVHGLTVGELAQMINTEGWLKNGVECDLRIIKCDGYSHKDFYQLPIKPSPNLPNMNSIYLYPSLCLFEGTEISVGRGTEKQFQVIGNPLLKNKFEFLPISRKGATNPPFKGEKCFGYDLSLYGDSIKQHPKIELKWLLEFYHNYPNKELFFKKNGFFDLLAGTPELLLQIVGGETQEKIKASWQKNLSDYKILRKKYLLYPDFE